MAVITENYNVQGAGLLDSAMACTKPAKNLQKYIALKINGVNLNIQNYLNAMTPNWIVDVIEKEHYHLAEHHLYGSARLGIKGYWPNQLYSLWDYSDTSNIIIDTTLLQSRQAWYSAMYQDGIRPDVVEPWNSTFTNPAAMQTIIGQKQYEQTDHLGNVVITASDKKYAIADISDSVITAYHAELPSTYDYYPFGMLMPGRYTSDTSTQCATITQTVLVPTVTTYTDALTAAAALNISPSALSNVTNTTINVATTAANQGITLALANVELLKDNSFELTVSRIPTGLEYLAEVYEYNLNDTVLLTSMAIDRDATFTLTFKPSGSGNLGLVLKTVNALSSTSTTKFKNFYTTVTTYTAQSITSTICNTGGDRYRFGFNGMEKDNEMKGTGNSLDFGARMYDSRLGRWLSMDPLVAKYPGMSPYNFAANSPILLIDPDGEKIEIAFYELQRNGKLKATKLVCYENGKLINDDGSEFKGNKFLDETVQALNELMEESQMSKDLITHLVSSPHTHRIGNIDPLDYRKVRKELAPFEEDLHYFEKNKHRSSYENESYKSFTKYTNNNTGYSNVDGLYTREKRYGLLHELWHAFDRDIGKNNSGDVKEKRAVAFTNEATNNKHKRNSHGFLKWSDAELDATILEVKKDLKYYSTSSGNNGQVGQGAGTKVKNGKPSSNDENYSSRRTKDRSYYSSIGQKRTPKAYD